MKPLLRELKISFRKYWKYFFKRSHGPVVAMFATNCFIGKRCTLSDTPNDSKFRVIYKFILNHKSAKSLITNRRFNAIVSQLKISLFWVIYIIGKPRYCCVGIGKFATLHAVFGNWYDQIYSSFFSNCEEIKLSKAPSEK